MRILLLSLFLLSFSMVPAQNIPNHSFESWDSTTKFPIFSEPLNWKSSNHHTAGMPSGPGVKRNADAYSADSSAELKTLLLGFNPTPYPGWIVNGEPELNIFGIADLATGGTPVSNRPILVEGYYKYTSIAIGDTARTYVMVKRWDTNNKVVDTLSYDSMMLTPNGSWTKFTFPVVYTKSGIPDSIVVGFFTTSPTSPKAGNTVLMDSIHVTLAPDTTDGGVSSIHKPLSSVNFLDTQNIEVTIKNYYASVMQSFDLGLQVDGQHLATEAYSGLIDSLDSADYTFTYRWVPIKAGNNLVCAYTDNLANDIDLSNDTTCSSINVSSVIDAGVNKINRPISPMSLGQSSFFEVQVQNYGNNALNNFEIEWSLDGVPMQLDTFKNTLQLLDSAIFTFSKLWTPLDTGTYNVCAYTHDISGDGNTLNDTTCQTVEVQYVIDAAIRGIVTPTFQANANEGIVVSAYLRNEGNTPITNVDVSYTVEDIVQATYSMTDTIAAGDSLLLKLDSSWIEHDPFTQQLCVYIDGFAADTFYTNDTSCKYVDIYGDYDLGVISITNPGAVNVGDSIEIEVEYVNYGDLNLDYFFIKAGNGQSPAISDLITDTIKVGDTATHLFTTKWVVPEGLSFDLCSWPDLGIDADSSNDTSCAALQIIGIADNEVDDIDIYPNPNNGVIYIKTNGVIASSIEVYSINGLLMGQYAPKSDGKIDLHLPNGIYIASWIDSKGNKHNYRITVLL